MDSDEELEENTLLHVVAAVIENQKSRICRQPCRESILTGHRHVQEILHGHPRRCYEQYRMEKFVFLKLTHILREKGLLRDSRWITIEEQLAIFLLTIGHNEDNRMLQERFHHSGETISRYFNEVLRAMMELSKELIKPPSFAETPAEILNNSKYSPWFKDCVGTIDGTHIKVIVPLAQQTPYFDRKENISHNVMAACSFDLRFTYIYAVWEGSANDREFYGRLCVPEGSCFLMPLKGSIMLSMPDIQTCLGFSLHTEEFGITYMNVEREVTEDSVQKSYLILHIPL